MENVEQRSRGLVVLLDRECLEAFCWTTKFWRKGRIAVVVIIDSVTMHRPGRDVGVHRVLSNVG